MSSQRHRMERFKQLIERHAVDLRHTTAGEDLAPWLDGEVPLPEWVAVTRHGGDYTYLYPEADFFAARRVAERHMLDDIHEEQPVEVVNLDTGERHVPIGALVEWEQLP